MKDALQTATEFKAKVHQLAAESGLPIWVLLSQIDSVRADLQQVMVQSLLLGGGNDNGTNRPTESDNGDAQG